MTRLGRFATRRLLIGATATILAVGIGLVIAQDQETLRIQTTMTASDPTFPVYLARLIGHPLTSGDSYTVLTNGDVAFPVMLAAIEAAQTRISVETYVFEPDHTGRVFQRALAAAARRGVNVRLVLDSVGASKMTSEMIDGLESAGAHVGWYNQVAGYSLEEANYRTHRKALIVDGIVAYVGGMGFADQWAFDTPDQPQWRDTQLELRGPVVDHVEGAFNENWIETVGVAEPLLQASRSGAPGSAQSIVVRSSSQGGTNSLKLLYLVAIASARRTLDIQSPYVVLDESSRWSLAEARERGVRIRILMEGDITDAKPVKFAGRAYYEGLLALGIELYEYQPAMMHAKVLVVDGVLSIFGSANFDNRSLELNDELNVAAFDRDLAARLTADFDDDRRLARRISLEEWRSRPLHIRGRDKVWSLFGEVF